MSWLTKTPDMLLSRKIRLNAINGKTGSAMLEQPWSGNNTIRKIGKLTKLAADKKQDGGVLGWLWDKTASFVGWAATEAWKLVSFSATAIFSWIMQGAQAIWTFNWNASDKELEQSIASSNVSLAATWGSFLGQGIGWLAGIGVGYGVSFLCPVIGGAGLAKLIAAKTSKEAVEELLPALRGAITSTAQILGKNALTRGYMSFRQLLKKAPRGALEALYGKDGADFIQQIWGREGGPNMSFAKKMDEFVDDVSGNNTALKVFLESLLEESFDSFMEAGFVVAAEIDNAYSQAKEASKKSLGSDRAVELTFNKDAQVKEKLQLVKLPQRLMIPEIQRQINHYRIMQNRDIGLFMGQPIEDYAYANPQSLRIIVDFYSVKEPPFFKNSNSKFVRSTIAIPDVKRGAVDWNLIKTAVGGANGYLWGRFRCQARLDNGRIIVVYAATENEGQERINALLQLTNAKLLTLNVMEEKKVGERLKRERLQKQSTRVYPAFFTVINRQELLDPERGQADSKRNYRDAQARIPLWLKEEPDNAKELIRGIFTRGS